MEMEYFSILTQQPIEFGLGKLTGCACFRGGRKKGGEGDIYTSKREKRERRRMLGQDCDEAGDEFK